MIGLAALALLGLAGRGPCDPPSPNEAQPSRDLYCIELFPAVEAAGLRGTAALDWAAGPFSIAVAPDGSPRYSLTFDLHGLPPLPPGVRPGFVAWAAASPLAPLLRLGSVIEGRTRLGPVALDRFLILVSAESDTSVTERRGPLVLRGESAASRLRPPDLFQLALGALLPAGTLPAHAHHGMADTLGWTPVPMLPGFAMLPSEMALRPGLAPWLPPDDSAAPPARPRRVVRLATGDTLDLTAGVVRRSLAGRSFTMFGFNGQYPGPLLQVDRGATVVVRFRNALPLPSTVHWHGLRLDARFDGVPGLSQPAVAPGGSFVYRLRFPDAGLYWYHPHVREDIEQDLGLYGNILVRPHRSRWPAAREEFLLLDDLLVNDDGLVPYGRDTPTHAAMGRFGNLLLVNGEPRWETDAVAGETVRLYLTNAANARTFNLSLQPEVPLALRAGDVGSYPEPVATDHLVLGPAERYVADVRFPAPGDYALVNRVRALDHLYGRFVPLTDTLGLVRVRPGPPPGGATEQPDLAAAAELASYLARAGGAPEKRLELRVDFRNLPYVSARLMRLDSIFFAPVEWAGTMPTMNWATSARQAHWILRDPETGREGMEIGWRFRRHTLLRLRLVGARDVLHAMQHPIHLHGQRFLVLAVGGVRNPHPVWKDTVLVPAGGTVELLADLSNPGPWMLHCHIAEHLGAGMMTTIDVEEE